MPLEGIAITDAITGLVQFRTSMIAELILSPQTLARSRRHAQWKAAAKAALPPHFWDEMAVVYEPYHHGMSFIELIVDYPDHDDVPGFIDYARTMPAADFVFYVLGRILTREQIIQTGLTMDKLSAALESDSMYHTYCCADIATSDILDDVPAFQNRLADFWQMYWDGFLSDYADELYERWDDALLQKEMLLEQLGGEGLLDYVMGKKHLPPPLPENHPITEIVFSPMFLTSRAAYMFFGYGNVTVLFDSERTEARQVEVEQAKAEALGAFKALGDANRLKILRLIASKEGEINGKKIAAKLKLSTSAVSRHLAQLRDGGLLVEETQDNRNITYRLQKDFIATLPDKLFDYLYS